MLLAWHLEVQPVSLERLRFKLNRKRHTSDSSWEFLRIENKQIKRVQNDSYGKNWHKTTYFCVEAIKSKQTMRGKLGHMVQVHICRLV